MQRAVVKCLCFTNHSAMKNLLQALYLLSFSFELIYTDIIHLKIINYQAPIKAKEYWEIKNQCHKTGEFFHKIRLKESWQLFTQ